MVFKWFNPFYQLARKVTGKKNFTKYQTTLANNGQRLNQWVQKIVADRRAGKTKSGVKDGADFLSIFLESDYFTDAMIADEILDFWGAATLTSQFTTTATLLACFQHPEVL